MKGFICFVLGILVGVGGYTIYQKSDITLFENIAGVTVDDLVGTYSGSSSHLIFYDEPNPIGFPDYEWVIVITKLSETKFKIEGSISTTGEINNGKIYLSPTKYKNRAEHIDISYTLNEKEGGLYMQVKCIGEAYSKNKLKLYDKTIYLDFRKVADYDYRAK